MTHRLPIRVYFEDTDFGGIVYYANYLKFIERGRSEMIREMGIDQKLMKDVGVVFAVRKVEADYLSPAKYDDELMVETTVQTQTAARMIFKQDVIRGTDLLFSALVTVVAITETGQPTRLPAVIRRNFH